MKALLITAVMLASAVAAHAQVPLRLPDQSPAASVSQTIGLTEVTVKYHRPAVNGRVIWGKLVPYNEPWRTGANENTLVSFSTDVKINGKPLPAGTYGFHAIPTAKDWTVMFSKATESWGSFSYDAKEDALRLSVAPRRLAASEERLIYKFDEPSETKATLVLAWEKLAIPLAIEVDTPKLVMESVRQQLRGPAGFSWQGTASAASYWLKHDGPIDEALALIDRSIGEAETYRNLSIKADLLVKKGDAKAADALRVRAMAIATEQDINGAGYRLINDKKYDEAIRLLQANADKHPESMNAQSTLGDAYAAKGNKPAAAAAYTRALALARDPSAKKQLEGALAKVK
ncbi:MAG TPA: DUF2911 domain-containing protein [Kofleriaceae bacterium]